MNLTDHRKSRTKGRRLKIEPSALSVRFHTLSGFEKEVTHDQKKKVLSEAYYNTVSFAFRKGVGFFFGKPRKIILKFSA